MRKGPLDKIETELAQATLLKGLRLLAERMASKAGNGVVFKVLAARGPSKTVVLEEETGARRS